MPLFDPSIATTVNYSVSYRGWGSRLENVEPTVATLTRPSRTTTAYGGRVRVARVTAWTLVWVGLFTLSWVLWLLYGTGFTTRRSQDALAAEWAASLELSPTPSLPASAPPERPALAASGVAVSETAGAEGSPLGRLIIRESNIDHVLVEGVEPDTLKTGPGHMPWTPVPGQPGNAVISGHRTTYGAPFFDLDELAPGDEVIVETAIGTHVFEVRRTFVVDPTDVWVTEPLPGAWLTLTTCTPKFSASQRLVIQAELVAGPNVEAVRASTEAVHDHRMSE